jgi:hypothetical protein
MSREKNRLFITAITITESLIQERRFQKGMSKQRLLIVCIFKDDKRTFFSMRQREIQLTNYAANNTLRAIFLAHPKETAKKSFSSTGRKPPVLRVVICSKLTWNRFAIQSGKLNGGMKFLRCYRR